MSEILDFLGSVLIFAIGGLLGLEFSRIRYRPKVDIRYEDVAPLYHKNNTYYSVNVINTGRTAATECACVISLPDVEAADLMRGTDASPYEELPPNPEGKDKGESVPRPQILDPDVFRPIEAVSLCWAALGNPSRLNVNPGTIETIDVLKIETTGEAPYFVFPSEKGWQRLRLRMWARPLEGQIRICPSNEFPTVLDFQIDRDGEGNYVLNPKPPQMSKNLKTRLRRLGVYEGTVRK